MELQIFHNDELGSMRTTTIEGEPFFVGKDVAVILGYKDTNNALKAHVDSADKQPWQIISSGQRRIVTLINESGLYSLVFSSKLPKAKQFKRWVTSDVVPAIRKHGVYAMDDLLKNPDVLIQALKGYKAEREKRLALEAKTTQQQQLITAMEPKVSYYDHVLASPDLASITVIAKDYGWSGVRMNEYLHDKRIQYRQGDTWVLYSDYADKGYTGTKTMAFEDDDGELHSKMHTYWTQKGRLFIYDTLKADGILPQMERE